VKIFLANGSSSRRPIRPPASEAPDDRVRQEMEAFLTVAARRFGPYRVKGQTKQDLTSTGGV
jgi:hypothetical protein